MIYFLINLVEWVFSFYSIIILVRVLLSWVSPDPFNPVVQFIHKATEPLLYQIRRIIPMRWSMIDFSPIVAFILLEIVKRVIIQTLIRFA